MTKNYKRRSGLLIGALLAAPCTFATNGMLLEGMGPESAGMGGVSQAVENGTAAMINNPATLGLMDSASGRFDFAVGNLRPDVSTDFMGANAESDGDSYLMPALGYVRKGERLAYGIGVFSQGGMGTEYGSDTFLGQAAGGTARSEVGIGSVLFPVSYDVNDRLTVGGTLQYVWGGVDMIFGMPVGDTSGVTAPNPGTFADFTPGAPNVLGSANGTLFNSLGPALADGSIAGNDSAVFNFSNDNDFSGEANGDGIGGSLGLMYQVTARLRLGGSYRAKTNLSDFKGNGSMDIVSGTDGSTKMSFPGEYTIKDFQFPAVSSVGLAYQATPATLLALDVSHIDWSDVMGDFKLSFTADGGAGSVDVAMKQNWKDQNVVKLGVEHTISTKTKVRAGLNLASNPVPDEYLNPLFPAIIENHVTAGFTHRLNTKSAVSGAVSHAPEVEQTNSNTGMTSSHSQTNLQFMYSRTF